jgi:asparagine synthase (glutamine-hydrolysing)
MPVVNEKKDIVLIFSGEHFADRSITQKLNGLGYPDGPKAGAFLQMYEDEGEAFLRRLNGWFCGLLVDLRNSKIILFNDRFGMQRVHYHEGKSHFSSVRSQVVFRIKPELRRSTCRAWENSLAATVFLRIERSSRNFIVARRRCMDGNAIWPQQEILLLGDGEPASSG